MERQPQNPEFRNNPENFHPCSNGTHGLAISILMLAMYHAVSQSEKRKFA